nr:retrotransposon protein, putative, unclassified [Tanacetum cinerariifolium]
MDLESALKNDVAKLPLLKQGDYEMWKLRIEQYFQVQDYAPWDVIENGNSFNLVLRTIANADGNRVTSAVGKQWINAVISSACWVWRPKIKVKHQKDGIFLSQDKYVYDISKKFGFFSIKSANTPMETHKPLSKDENGTNVDVYLYSLDRISTTGGCQFLGSRLISLQCKKQTIMANSTTKLEYIAASNCYGQGMDTGGCLRRQETIGGTPAQTRVTTLENELLSTKAVYHKAFITLTKRVKKLETQLKQKRSRAVIHSSDDEEPSLDIEDSPKQGRIIGEIDKDKNVNLVSEQGEVHKTTKPLKDDDDATLADTLLNIKRTTTKDKGKGIMQKTELPNKIKKREMIQLSLDEELAQKLHVEELEKETTRQ